MLTVKNIFFNYNGASNFKGLQNVSFELPKGKFLAVIGKSGSGKTTLLKCIYGLEDLFSGEIVLENEKILGPSYNLIPGNSNMGFVSQDFYILDNHTVEENIKEQLVGYTDVYKLKRSTALLKLLDLQKFSTAKVNTLSSGQRQRVAIARALALPKKILLLDEPFSNLDIIMKKKLYEFIKKDMRQNNTSIILVTHQPAESKTISDYTAIINEGKILQFDKTKIVFKKPKNKTCEKLIGNFS
ncbi:MAG: ABC transporter ATP-binding protein [Bacteroidetes bacterium]|nr:ABC transporter ATP-binding protein [Bacteroidota bacterium]